MHPVLVLALALTACVANAESGFWKMDRTGALFTHATNIKLMNSVPILSAAGLTRYIVTANRTDNCEIFMHVSEYLMVGETPVRMWSHNFTVPTTSTKPMLFMKGNEPHTVYVWDPVSRIPNEWGGATRINHNNIPRCTCDTSRGCLPSEAGTKFSNEYIRAADIKSGTYTLTKLRTDTDTQISSPDFFAVTERSAASDYHVHWGSQTALGGTWEVTDDEQEHSFDTASLTQGHHVMCKNYMMSTFHFINTDTYTSNVMVKEAHVGVPDWNELPYSTGPADPEYRPLTGQGYSLACSTVFIRNDTVMLFDPANNTKSYVIGEREGERVLNSDFAFIGLF
jgi:hypothetical protein